MTRSYSKTCTLIKSVRVAKSSFYAASTMCSLKKCLHPSGTEPCSKSSLIVRTRCRKALNLETRISLTSQASPCIRRTRKILTSTKSLLIWSSSCPSRKLPGLRDVSLTRLFSSLSMPLAFSKRSSRVTMITSSPIWCTMRARLTRKSAAQNKSQ